MAKKKVIPQIAEAEKVLAAKYLTLSNVAMLNFLDRSRNDIEEAFRQANEACVMEAGASLSEELHDWYDAAKKNDPYICEEWHKVRSKYVNN